MALSGNFTGNKVGGFSLKTAWVGRQNSDDITNNRTYVTQSVYLVIDSGWSTATNTSKAGSTTLNGSASAFSKVPGSLGAGEHLIATRSSFVNHGADGTKKFSLSAWFDLNVTITGFGWVGRLSTGSKEYTLDPIPRASKPTTNHDSRFLGEVVRIYTNRASSNFTHTVDWLAAGNQKGTVGTDVGTYVDFTLPSGIAWAMTNSTSRSLTFTVKTYSGSTFIGSNSVVITAKLPDTSEYKPSFSAVTVSENVDSVETLVGAYVQTKSRLNLEIVGASGVYGSTIRSYNIKGVGHNVNSSSTVTGLLSVSGNQTITGTVTDSRGQTFSKSIVVNILPYTPPALSDLSFRRTLPDKTEAPLGDNVTVRANVKVQSLIVNGVEKNSIKYHVQSAQTGYSFADKANTTSTSLTESYSDVWSGYSVDYSYNFRVRVGDVFGFGGWSVGIVPTGIVTQQWGSKTTSFGKMIDDTSYNVQVGTGGIQSDGPIIQNGIAVAKTTDISDFITNTDRTVHEYASTVSNANSINYTSTANTGSTASNIPVNDWGLLLTHAHTSNHVIQIWARQNGAEFYMRLMWDGSWNPWRKIY